MFVNYSIYEYDRRHYGNSRQTQRNNKLIREYGFNNLPTQDNLSQRFDVTQQQICKDIQFIIQSVPKETLDEIFTDLIQTYLTLLYEVKKIALEGDDKQKLQATDTITKLGQAITKLLEDWGRKEKVADKLETTTRNYTINIKAPEPKEKIVVIDNRTEKEKLEDEDGAT